MGKIKKNVKKIGVVLQIQGRLFMGKCAQKNPPHEVIL